MVLAASFFASGGLFSQPQLVFVLFAGAVWLIKQINRSKNAGARPASAPQVGGPPEPGGGDGPAGQVPDDEERTRRVREDILRKIAARRAGTAAPTRTYYNPLAPDPQAEIAAALFGSGPPAKATAAAASSAARSRATAMPAGPSTPPVYVAAAVAGPSAGALWLEELRTRDSVRRAIVVREILGPPVALRRVPAPATWPA
jgi:hypothetical protein